MFAQRDILITLGADGSNFQDALKQAQNDVKAFVREVEKTSKSENIGQIRNRTMRAMGLDPWAERAKSARQEMELFQRDRFAAPGIGQEMVAPHRISSETAAMLDKSRISIGGIAKASAASAAAIEAAAIATKIWKGDIAGAADVIKTLPFGIGSVARALEGVLGEWTGITAEIEKQKELQTQSNRDWDATVGNMKRRNRDKKAVEDNQRAAAMALASEKDKPFMQLDAEHQARMKAAHSDAERNAILKRYQAERIALIRQQTDREMAEVDRQFEQDRKRDEDKKKEALEREKDFIEKQQKAKEDAMKLDGELEVARLKAAGKTREAEQAAIRSHYAILIRDAYVANNHMKVKSLEELRDLAIAAVKPETSKKAQNTAISARFLTGMPGSSVNVSSQWEKNEKRLGELRTEAKRQNTLLERLIQVTREQMGGTERIMVYNGA